MRETNCWSGFWTDFFGFFYNHCRGIYIRQAQIVFGSVSEVSVMIDHERSPGLSNMKRLFLCVLFVLWIVLCSASRAPPSTFFYTHESSESPSRSSTNFQPSFKLPHPPTGQVDAGRFGVDKRRVPTGSNPLHNR